MKKYSSKMLYAAAGVVLILSLITIGIAQDAYEETEEEIACSVGTYCYWDSMKGACHLYGYDPVLGYFCFCSFPQLNGNPITLDQYHPSNAQCLGY